MKQIKLSEVIQLLKSGYTRLPRDERALGNIKEHFGLSHTELKELFSHSKLKGIKTRFPSIQIIDDIEETKEQEIIQSEDSLIEEALFA